MEQSAFTMVVSTNQMIEWVGTIVIPLEIVFLTIIKRNIFYGDTYVNLICGAASLLYFQVIDGNFPFYCIEFVRQHGPYNIPPSGWGALAHIVVGDLCFYLFHRMAHTKYLFTLEHSVHHSSREFDYSTNLRFSFFAIIYSWTPLIIPALLGFNSAMLLACFFLSNSVPFFFHTRYIGKLGWIETIFNTPSHHRVHHGRNPCYVNKNFGGMLIIWDRLFGTYAEEIEPIEFGVEHITVSRNPLKVIFRGWIDLLSRRRNKQDAHSKK